MKLRLQLALLAALLFFAGGCDLLDKLKGSKGGGDETEEQAAMTILTGSKKGNYYKTAKELNEVLGEDEQLTIKESVGSFQNVADLGAGKAQLAIAQYDSVVVYLRLGKSFTKLAQNSVVVAPLSEELVHIIVNKKAGIKSVKDLKGKKLSVGPEHSGSWISAFLVMLYLNDVNIEKAEDIEKLPYDESLEKVIAGELDVMFVTTSPGMPLLKKAEDADGNIELLDLPKGLKLHKDISNVYALKKIEGDTYPWQSKEVRTLSTPSYLLAYAKADAGQVEKLAKTVYGKAAKLKKKSDLWKNVSEKRAKADIKNRVPYHKGAKRALGVK